MSGEITKQAKYIFLLHFIVALVFGALWFFAPGYWNTLTGWPPQIASGRIVGMATIMMAIGCFLAYRATSWQQVEIFVVMELIYNIVGAIGMLWSVIEDPTLPLVAWLLIGLLGLFALLFLYVYFTGKKK
jgi:O-antigen/teichoic acid export membrane protein